MAAIPTSEEEDAKRPNREREHLVGRCTSVTNRLKATLVRLGIRGFNPKLPKAAERLATLRTPEGEPIPPNTLAELQRDMAQLRFIKEQIKQIETARREQLKQAPEKRSNAKVMELESIRGIGVGDRGYARARSLFARVARSAGSGALCWADRLTR